MEAKQIKQEITRLVEDIDNEDFLQACFDAVEGIAKAYHRMADAVPTGASEPEMAGIRRWRSKTASVEFTEDDARHFRLDEVQLEEIGEEQIKPYDLSFVLMANEVMKGSEPLPGEAAQAFGDALLASALKEPTLPNRR